MKIVNKNKRYLYSICDCCRIEFTQREPQGIVWRTQRGKRREIHLCKDCVKILLLSIKKYGCKVNRKKDYLIRQEEK